jgi:hypothetical protein
MDVCLLCVVRGLCVSHVCDEVQITLYTYHG